MAMIAGGNGKSYGNSTDVSLVFSVSSKVQLACIWGQGKTEPRPASWLPQHPCPDLLETA